MRFEFFESVVVDSEKGIVWARDANISDRFIEIEEAAFFLEKLNSEKFGGQINWRLPTFEGVKGEAL